jgi:carbamoyl-phosphate synthase large subunit
VLREHHVQLYLMGIDAEIPVVSALRGRIQEEVGCKIVVSDDRFVQSSTDKLATADMLRDLGLSSPRTVPGGTPVDAVLDQLGLPIVAKPRRGHGSQGVRVIQSRAELVEQAPWDDAYCLQEYLPGEEYTCALLYDRRGCMRDFVCFRRQLHLGTTIEAEVVRIDALEQLIERFAGSVRAEGSINLQIRLDRHDCPAIFEINPRFSGTTSFRVACGFNDPLRVALHYLHDEPIRPAPVRPVRIFRYFEEWVVPL